MSYYSEKDDRAMADGIVGLIKLTIYFLLPIVYLLFGGYWLIVVGFPKLFGSNIYQYFLKDSGDWNSWGKLIAVLYFALCVFITLRYQELWERIVKWGTVAIIVIAITLWILE